jgi:hypothetical protein
MKRLDLDVELSSLSNFGTNIVLLVGHPEEHAGLVEGEFNMTKDLAEGQ